MMWLTRPWRHAFDYKGRSPRREYWLFAAQFLIGLFLIGALGGVVGGAAGADPTLADIPLALFVLAAIPVGLATAVRRLHDHDKAGWFVLIYFVPFVGALIFLVLMLLPGTDGWNAYGDDPRLGDEQVQDMTRIFS